MTISDAVPVVLAQLRRAAHDRQMAQPPTAAQDSAEGTQNSGRATVDRWTGR